MWLIGLTGGIATGKSTVSKMLAAAGVSVIDLDELAREVVQPGRPALAAIVAAFGKEYLLSDGTLDRKRLGEFVFRDATARQQVVIDAPLLFETHMDRWLHRSIVVACDADTQVNRLMARDSCTREQAQQRISAQFPLADKIAKADLVIDNNADPAALSDRVREQLLRDGALLRPRGFVLTRNLLVGALVGWATVVFWVLWRRGRASTV